MGQAYPTRRLSARTLAPHDGKVDAHGLLANAEWDAAYKKRWEEERANSQLKANRTLEDHYFRELASVTVPALLPVCLE